jgi:hypothetical protein
MKKFLHFLTTAILIAGSLLVIAPAHSAAGTVGTGNCQSTVGETSYFTASTSGNYCILTFKAAASTSTISSTWTVPSGVQAIQVLVVGGGGGGGSDIGGGGGGGRVIDSSTIVSPGAVTSLTAGQGGGSGNGTYSTNNTLNNTGGVTGTSSSFGSITALGGSGAIGRTKSSGTATGWDYNGWTGGGGGYGVTTVTAGVGGSSYQGGAGNNSHGGGGGGSGGAGSAGVTTGGAGGTGTNNSITGTSVCYGGGGGGGTNGTVGSATCGGAAGTSGNPTPTTATPGLGGGGGGGGGNASPNGGQGGSGVVIIRWLPGQTITFTQLADQNIDNYSSASLVATSTSSLAVTFSSSTPSICTVSLTTVTFATQGSCIIQADQIGNGSYQAAPSVSMTFTIGGVVQLTITSSTPFIYRTTETITVVTAGLAGKVTLKQGKVRIPGCISRNSSAGNSFTVTCVWKPSQRGNIAISAIFDPTSSTYSTTTQQFVSFIAGRTNKR